MSGHDVKANSYGADDLLFICYFLFNCIYLIICIIGSFNVAIHLIWGFNLTQK